MKIGFVGDPHTGRMRALLGNERGDAAHARLWLRQIEWVREAGCSHAVIVGDVRYEVLEMHQGALITGQLRPLFEGEEKPTLKLASNNQ